VSVNPSSTGSCNSQVAQSPTIAAATAVTTTSVSNNQSDPVNSLQVDAVQYAAFQSNASGEPVLPFDPATPQPLPPVGADSEAIAPGQPLGSPKLTLDQAVQECLAADPQIRAGREAINQAIAGQTTAGLLPNPQVTVDGIFLPFHTFTPQQPGGPPQNDVLINYPVDWFLFGKRAAALTAAQRGIDVSNADFQDLVRQRISGTIQAFFDVLAAQAFLEISQQNLNNFQRVQSMTQKQLNLGGIGAVELDRARLAVFDAGRDLRDKETALVSAKAALRAAIGRNGPESDFAVAGSLEVLKPMAPIKSEDALAIAENSRPDINSLRRKIAKAEADLRVQQKTAYPTLSTQGGLSRQYQTSLGFPDASSYDVSLNVSVPLFDRNQGNIRKAQSTITQSDLNLEAQLVSLRAEIVQDAQEFQTAYQNVTSDDPQELQTATKVRESINSAYALGGRPFTDVLEAERAYRDTYLLFISSHSNYWHSLYKLNAAMGEQILQ